MLDRCQTGLSDMRRGLQEGNGPSRPIITRFSRNTWYENRGVTT